MISGSFVVDWWLLVVILRSFDGLLVVLRSHSEQRGSNANVAPPAFPILATLGFVRCRRSGWWF